MFKRIDTGYQERAKRQFAQIITFIQEMPRHPLTRRRSWHMPGIDRYQPQPLLAFLGYDQWAVWLILVEWFWMHTLAIVGVMSRDDAHLLTFETLREMIIRITTTRQDFKEKKSKTKTNHDILALLILMRRHLPRALHKWLHNSATSYDIISTAYALQLSIAFREAILPDMLKLDLIWRRRIGETLHIVQAGRTHLQTALPVTVGFWLTTLHSRYLDCGRRLISLSRQLQGKFSGAVGTYAAQRAIGIPRETEAVLMGILGLKKAPVSTQIAPPESIARFYGELEHLAGALANLAEDVRLLQSSQFSELSTISSTSSAMPHKTGNPIAAENMMGSYSWIKSIVSMVRDNLVSDLQRDLRNSSPMRGYTMALVFFETMISTCRRLFESMRVNKIRCRENFQVHGHLVVAELLHLSLQGQGAPDTHHLVNKVIAPLAVETGDNLLQTTNAFILSGNPRSRAIDRYWQQVPLSQKLILAHPEKYLGDAKRLARIETRRKLTA